MAPISPDPALAAASKLAGVPAAGKPHGIALPNSKKPGYSAVYRNHLVGTGELIKTIDPSVTTMFEAFEGSCRKYPNNKCLGWRDQDKIKKTWGPYQWIDYKTVQERRTNLGMGLRYLHQKAGITQQKVPVGIWSQNRVEWQLADLACMSQSMFSVSIYDTLGPDTAVYIINHAELTTVVAALNHIPTLLQIASQCPGLKYIISMDPLDNGEGPGMNKKSLLSSWGAEKGIEIYSISEAEALGAQNPCALLPPLPSDAITINYTSGTTGFPKGVLLTHSNCIAACSIAMTTCMYMTSSDVILSYLPLAHIFGRLTENAAMWGGTAIGYFHGNILELFDDIKLLRPTTFISVPRLYNRISNAIKEGTIEAPGIKGALSRHAMKAKLENMKTTGSNKHALYDTIWANKVKAAIGFDRCRGMVSGSAPIAQDVLQTLRVVFSNDFIEGYGLTESYAVALGQLAGDNSAGNCGPPSIANEIKLRDVPDMGYTSNDTPYPRGELLIRGHSVFSGYYKNESQTSEVIDSEGWFATGDICRVDELGRFSIIDRVKNLLKLAQGEYVSPEKIENVYLANFPVLAQGLVHGDSLQTYLVAVFGVDRPQFAVFASGVLGRKIDAADDKVILEACKEKKVRKQVVKELEKMGKKAKLQGFEKVKNVHLCLDPFTIENDLLTPTLKMKRAPAIKQYKDILDALYEETDRENPQKAKL
ncbi:hypothetical protein FPQ18DRAFT_321625 [Pyronema domesticum]|uniref:Similar to Long chain acyl-CoA synthetase 7, peroxisomal acc. no. Q8LKS5 n=1 Tax=Pyronema omphalodes (strain CBS 100304) TaxID=1076935 RepID=U4LK96_PYROM|nr:hypothetical protein FPQ18DRAFT_321625 [Pyronema domesticum]CCX31992.1 Similar to Long chain acyl-CoA synthetase 7, peroxisomal; acc. no. Q8LKS5 [Pyronema omphalodes CBS 100304]